MPINFPNSPAPNEVYTIDQKSWRYTGTAWNVISGTYGYLCRNHGVMAGTITVRDISTI